MPLIPSNTSPSRLELPAARRGRASGHHRLGMVSRSGGNELQVANSPGKGEAGESGGQRLGFVKGESLPWHFFLPAVPQWLPSLQKWETMLIS